MYMIQVPNAVYMYILHGNQVNESWGSSKQITYRTPRLGKLLLRWRSCDNFGVGSVTAGGGFVGGRVVERERRGISLPHFLHILEQGLWGVAPQITPHCVCPTQCRSFQLCVAGPQHKLTRMGHTFSQLYNTYTRTQSLLSLSPLSPLLTLRHIQTV